MKHAGLWGGWVALVLSVGCTGSVETRKAPTKPYDPCGTSTVGQPLASIDGAYFDSYGPEVVAMAVDATGLYWTMLEVDDHDSTVRKVALDGSSPVRLDEVGVPTDLVIDAERVYWIDLQKGVLAVPKGGGPFTVLAAEPSAFIPLALAVDETHVYWMNYTGDDGDTLLKVPKAGGPATTLVTHHRATSGAMVMDATEIYWAGTTRLMKVSKEGGTPEVLAAAPDSIKEISLDEGNVYFTSFPEVGSDSSVVVRRVPKAGGTASTLATGNIVDVIVDGASLYWAEDDEKKSVIKRMPTGGGEAVTVVCRHLGITRLAVDEGFLYWADRFEHTMMRVPK